MTQRTHLIELAQTLANHQGVTHFAISMRIFGKGDFFHNLITKGWDCRTRTAERVMTWFDANWPVDLTWPKHIARPSAASKLPRGRRAA